jgi:mannose-6-phosphate isomerase-like protein (cupin superfamily)
MKFKGELIRPARRSQGAGIMGRPVFKCGIAFAALVMASFPVGQGFAQGGGRPPAQQWWTYKSRGGIYTAPNRPYWKLSDLKQQHAGQSSWQQLIISNQQQQATYNSAAPGSKFGPRMNTDTNALFVVIAGEMHFTVEGQQPVTATRGSIVNILNSTIHSWEIAGNQNALWIEVHPTDTNTVYPADGNQPPPVSGSQVVKVAFNHTPGVYTVPNQLHWNFFDAIANCQPIGVHVDENGLYASAIGGFATANDPADTCKGRGGPPTQGTNAAAPVNIKGTFGHMHGGKMEWWIVQSGIINGWIENAGDFHASEGDVMSAPQSTWHQMLYEGPGVSERLAIVPFPFNNENNTAGGD